jgi:general secretion pathway protein H
MEFAAIGHAAGPRGVPGRRAGFTLIEILIVLVIVGIMVALVGVNLARSDTDRARDEADRLTAVIETARDNAILESRVYALQATPEGYRFLMLSDAGKLVPVTDEPFQPHALPANVRLSLEVDGAPANQDAGLVFDPTGTLPLFTATFNVNQAHWYVLGLANGRVKSQPTRDERTA